MNSDKLALRADFPKTVPHRLLPRLAAGNNGTYFFAVKIRNHLMQNWNGLLTGYYDDFPD